MLIKKKYKRASKIKIFHDIKDRIPRIFGKSISDSVPCIFNPCTSTYENKLNNISLLSLDTFFDTLETVQYKLDLMQPR